MTPSNTPQFQHFAQSEQVNELFEALAKFQAQHRTLAHTRTVNAGKYSFDYTELHSVVEAIQPAFSDLGLSHVQPPASYYIPNAIQEESGSRGIVIVQVVTIIGHRSGQWMRSVMGMPVTLPSAQEIGKAVSFARRYALLAAIGIASRAEEDDDSGENTHVGEPPRQRAVAKPTDARAACVQFAQDWTGFTDGPDIAGFLRSAGKKAGIAVEGKMNDEQCAATLAWMQQARSKQPDPLKAVS